MDTDKISKLTHTLWKFSYICISQNLKTNPQLTQLKKYDNTSDVWYSRQDGWWLETHTDELFLDPDSSGAMYKITQLLNKN